MCAVMVKFSSLKAGHSLRPRGMSQANSAQTPEKFLTRSPAWLRSHWWQLGLAGTHREELKADNRYRR